MRLTAMRFVALLGLACGLFAQSPARVTFECSDDDLQALGGDCSENDPCQVFLELTGLEVVGPKLFLTGNLHTESTTLSSILLMSEDGGATWSEPHPRIRGAGLEQIQFLDFEAGWVGGQSLQGVAKDPFLLITRDGGKTWRAAPIFDEGRTGVIEQFWFESRTSGALLIDRMRSSEGEGRHELYETMTGGDSWSLRQVSPNPIVAKRIRPASNPDWRLRADAGTKSYRVERREGAKWTTVTLFPVRVGECKAKAPSLGEPPPPDQPEVEPAKPEDENPPKPAPKPRARPTLQKKRPPNQ
jgi:hypothetical protein